MQVAIKVHDNISNESVSAVVTVPFNYTADDLNLAYVTQIENAGPEEAGIWKCNNVSYLPSGNVIYTYVGPHGAESTITVFS